MRPLPLIGLLFACSETPAGGGTDETSGDDWQLVSYLDEGTVCFDDQAAAIVVSVTAPDCLSSSCSREFGGDCEAALDGTVITVTSEITWEQNVGEDVPCTDDCGIPTVTCAIAHMADGTYTVRIGGVESTLEVPITEPCYPY
ncbi:MAG: hypothetical protein H0V89_13615 [Deltaproteobacteria bacterium]|nr:hypothetical protein [Deltaproteobacteria bacterium]